MPGIFGFLEESILFESFERDFIKFPENFGKFILC